MPKNEKTGSSEVPPSKRRGRPPRPTVPYGGPNFGLTDMEVTEVPLENLDLEDTTFQCRVTLKPELLVDSVTHHGIQMPLVVRKHPSKKNKLQIVCGFRRATAAKQVGLVRVPVLVRELDDDEAHILSYAENENRKTLGDMDRANGIAKLRQTGKKQEEVAQLYRLSERQVRRLEDLLTYPDVVKRALDDEQSGVTTTHATVIMQAARKHGSKFDIGSWVSKVRRTKPGVDDLRRMIREEMGAGRRPKMLFRRRGDRIALNIAAFREGSPARQGEAIRAMETVLRLLKREHAKTGTGH